MAEKALIVMAMGNVVLMTPVMPLLSPIVEF
jgi:hypothetical protein